MFPTKNEDLRATYRQQTQELKQFSDQLDTKGSAITAADLDQLKAKMADLTELRTHLDRADEYNEAKQFLNDLSGERTGKGWADEVATRITKTAGDYGVKAFTTGGIDIPQAVESVVTKPVEPRRVLDLLINRRPLVGNEFEYLRQTVRTNNAAAVADNAVKPTSVYTFEDESDRARVYAHLSEAIPLRYLADHVEIRNVLTSQMAEDLYLSLERDVLIGDGIGEKFLGITEVVGTQSQAYNAGGVLITLRKALTKLRAAGENPNAWVMNPTDLETIDLMREEGTTGGFLDSVDSKIFGDLPKIGSSIVPVGWAYLADWNQARLYVRDQGKLDADVSGVLFEKNQVRLRYEGRFGFAVLRPNAFIEVDLTP